MCTSILVGKKATIDGSVIIARNEDCGATANPKVFRVFSASDEKNRVYESENTGVKIELPNKALRSTGTPGEDPNEVGVYTESGINELNIAVSSSESLYGNERVLGIDPLVGDGIAEDAINDIVCPYIKSARDGVEYLGELIEKHGSAEGNGILFADEDEAWYMEIPTGHHWVAQRIPDDCYAVAPNRVCIEEVDFEDDDNFLYSTGLREFVLENNLNPNPNTFNFRKIFGTYTSHDRAYNTARAWYAHKFLRPDLEFGIEDEDIPFIVKADRLLSIYDVDYVLSSHYNDTEFDPIGKLGTESEKKRYRPISLCRTHESHILQIRNNVDEGVKGIHWLAMGPTAYTPYVPFFSNINDTPEIYRDMTEKLSLNNAYWIFKLLAYYSEVNRKSMDKEIRDFMTKMRSYTYSRVKEVTDSSKGYSGDDLTEFLTRENQKTSDYVIEKTLEMIQTLAFNAFDSSKLIYKFDTDL